MQKLCEYLFSEDPEIVPLLDMLRPGTGYRDLAADLNGYADIYEMRPSEVATDIRNYHETDVADARRIAGEILSQLSGAMSPQAHDAYDKMLRVWTLLVDVYAEVRTVTLCLLRLDPEAAKRIPSIYGAARAPRGKKKPAAPAPTPPATPPQT